ncbi:MAG: arylsulfotransferase family protein [Solirubrobacteraceae bacterium]
MRNALKRNPRLRRGLVAGVVLIVLAAGAALALAGSHIAGEQASYSASADRCTPETLDASDVLPGTEVAVSPMPGSYDAGPETQVSFLGVPVSKLSGISVAGSQTGPHPGRLEAYSQGDGASFLPAKPFQSGETVTVTGEVDTGTGRKRFSYHFVVAHVDNVKYTTEAPSRPAPPQGSVQSFHSQPELAPPTVNVDERSANAAPGYIFLGVYSGPGSKGPAIFNQQGQLVWMDALGGELKATNLQVQHWEGRELLTWWQGYITPVGFGIGEEVVDNTSYEEVMKINAGNGDMADLHDFHLDPHGTAVFTVFHTIDCDLSSVGGAREAAVTDALYQEIDVKTGLVRREWSSIDHVSLSESYSSASGASAEKPFDFFHLNTIDPREDGTTLLSSRNTSALWIIDTKTGQILQRVGGKKSTVKQEAGTRTAFQHDVMTLPNGNISIFDNGGSPFEEPYSETHSRGMIVELNAQTNSERLVQEFNHSPQLQAASQGDVQPQAGGNWFIGWGQEPYFSEYNAKGEIIYDAKMWAEKEVENKQRETESYRTYKFPWKAQPKSAPAIAAEAKGAHMQVWASWNGATEVSGWRLLGGPSGEALRSISTTAKSNFETAIDAPAEAYVKVQALDAAGEVIGESKTIAG